EWRKLISGTNINQQVPMPDTYGGDFTGFVPADIKDSTGAVILNSGLHAPCAIQLSAAEQTVWTNAGQGFSTPAPGGGCTADSSKTIAQNPTFTALNNNLLPFLDPNAQALLTAGGKFGGIFPAPTNGNRFQTPVSAPNSLREEIVRIDYNATSKLKVYG